MNYVDIVVMQDYIRNALLDPTAEFAIVPSPRLRELCAKDDHPIIQQLPASHKLTFMQVPDGQCILVERDGQSNEQERFVLGLCDIRFWPTSTKTFDPDGKTPIE